MSVVSHWSICHHFCVCQSSVSRLSLISYFESSNHHSQSESPKVKLTVTKRVPKPCAGPVVCHQKYRMLPEEQYNRQRSAVDLNISSCKVNEIYRCPFHFCVLIFLFYFWLGRNRRTILISYTVWMFPALYPDNWLADCICK